MNGAESPTASIRRLSKRASEVVGLLERDSEPILVTRHGVGVAYIVSLRDAERLGLKPPGTDRNI
jgi:prevent-host-death family protein